MFGIDLSNHQKGIDLSNFKFDFGIVKATEGMDFVDKSFRDHVAQLTRLNKLIGCYHFARPDNQNTVDKMKKAAEHFVTTVSGAGLLGKAILVLDWEKSPTNKYDLIEAFMNEVYSMIGVAPMIYANTAFFKQAAKDNWVCPYEIWLAKWPVKTEMQEFPEKSWIYQYFPEKINNKNWKIWQFTSNGHVPGWYGRVDYNYAETSATDWKLDALGSKHIEYLSYDMEWAISKKLFLGYNDGTYRESAHMTRGELATVLRRFYNMIEEEKK